MMLLVERHGKVCSGLPEFPLFNLFRVLIDNGDFADGRQIYKYSGTSLFQLKRLGVRPEFEITFDPFVGGGIESADRAVSVTDINTFRLRVIAKLVGVIREFHGIQQLVGVGIENLAGTIAFVRNDDAIQVRKIQRHLRLDEFPLYAVDPPASGDVKDFYRIIAIDGGEHTITFIVDSHVVETALNI